tara:strand:+ start:85 stop:1164 length:1080 start_codon:yes stop_codon:yes gene_type:complete
VRSYCYEWIIKKAFCELNILTTTYDFTEVYINSKYKGIYAIEDEITNNILNKYQRPYGPILKFDEKIAWEEESRFSNLQLRKFLLNETGNVRVTKIKNFKEIDYYQKDSLNEIAIDKLNKFRNGENVLEEYFDMKLWATYFSIAEIFGANHGVRWHNVRFYYNPNSGKIEPIAYDHSYVASQSILKEAYQDNDTQFSNELYLRLFFNNENFIQLYLEQLHLLIDSNFLQKIYDENQVEYSFYQNIFELEDKYIDEKLLLDKRLVYLSEVYSPLKPIYAYKKDDSIYFANSYFLPIEIISYQSGNVSIEIDSIKFNSKSQKEKLIFKRILNNFDKKDKLTVLYKIYGSKEIHSSKIENYY